jgi:hypothetical protein
MNSNEEFVRRAYDVILSQLGVLSNLGAAIEPLPLAAGAPGPTTPASA